MSQLSCDPNYIVFSSHKTGTQTITKTLRANHQEAIHLHHTANLGLTPDSFKEYLIDRRDRRKKQTIITNFRLPTERHISSFFQWHGAGVLRRNPGMRKEDTIISKYDISELNRAFVSDLSETSLVGYKESIHQIFSIFKLNPVDIGAGATEHSFCVEHELADIHFFRFDELFKDLNAILSSSLRIEVKETISRNISSEKWYSSKFKDFKRRVRMPISIIEKTYCYRRSLIEMYYPGSYNSLLEKDCEIYGN